MLFYYSDSVHLLLAINIFKFTLHLLPNTIKTMLRSFCTCLICAINIENSFAILEGFN